MADRYALSGNWNSTSTWSATSGGASGASVPTATDNVFFDANSGNVTKNVGGVCLDFDCLNYTGTINTTTSSALQCHGTVFRLSSGMTLTGNTWSVNFFATSGTVLLTSSGQIFGGFGSGAGFAGTIQLQDAWTCSAGVGVTSGVFDANDFNLTTTFFASNVTNTRVFSMGSGSWTLTGTSNIWNVNPNNLTWNIETATIVVTDTSGSDKQLLFGTIAGGQTIPPIIIHRPAIGDIRTDVRLIGGTDANPNTITSIAFVGDGQVRLQTGAHIQPLLNSVSLIGTREYPCEWATNSVTGFTPGTISAGSNDIYLEWCIVHVSVTGSGDYTALNCWKPNDLTGWDFSIPRPNPGPAFPNTITGITKDYDGNPLGSCDVWCFKWDPVESYWTHVSTDVSDAVTGEYVASATDTDSQYMVVANKVGSPNVFDVTDKTLTPV